MAQVVKCLTSARVTISRFVSSSPVSGSVPADGSEPGGCFGFCVSLCLSLCPSTAHALSLSLKNKDKKRKERRGFDEYSCQEILNKSAVINSE